MPVLRKVDQFKLSAGIETTTGDRWKPVAIENKHGKLNFNYSEKHDES